MSFQNFPNGETVRFIVDFGLYQEREYDKLNTELAFRPENLDFCLVTHVHVEFAVKVVKTSAIAASIPLYFIRSFFILSPHSLFY